MGESESAEEENRVLHRYRREVERNPCPSCQKRTARAQYNPQKNHILLVGGIDDAEEYIKVRAFVCLNCGFISFYEDQLLAGSAAGEADDHD